MKVQYQFISYFNLNWKQNVQFQNPYQWKKKTKLGELSKEEDVLEWLIENKSTGDDEEVIEDVTAKTLSTLIGNVDNLVVLFCM